MLHSRGLTRRAFLRSAVGVGALGPRRSLAAFAQPANSLNATDFGAIGDGETDDTLALQAGIDEASRQQRPLYLPSGSYLVTATLIARTNLTLASAEAVLRSAIAEYGDSSRPVPTLQVNDARNVTLRGLRIDGRGDDFDHNEYKHCVSIQGSDTVLIEDCAFFAAKGDGLIFNDLRPGMHNVNITVRRTTCAGNYRLGLAVTDAENALFEDCVFGDNRGTSPMAGVDIEPDRGDCRINQIVFKRCRISGNGVRDQDGAGVNIALVDDASETQGNIRFEDCTISENGIHGVLCYNSRDVEFANCEINFNGSSGFEVFRTSSNLKIDGGTISGNAVSGITAVRESDQVLSNLKVRRVTIENNSQDSPGAYDGVHLQGLCRDIEISDCTISGTHRYGIWIGEHIEDVTLANNDLAGNASGATYSDDSSSIGQSAASRLTEVSPSSSPPLRHC